MIFYCANTTAYHMPEEKFLEAGHWVKLDCDMGCCMKMYENHWFNPFRTPEPHLCFWFCSVITCRPIELESC